MLAAALIAAPLSIFGPGPAVAITDDRIVNDAVAVLNMVESVAEQGRVCAAATPGEPDVAAAFDSFVKRSSRWTVIALSVIRMRGGVDEELLGRSRALKLADTRATLAAKPDLAEDCRGNARVIAENGWDVANVLADETLRIASAREGRLPPLDLANSPAVADATALRQMVMNREATMRACGAATGDAAAYDADMRGWIERNVEAYVGAYQVFEKWGALAPGRMETATRIANEEAATVAAGPGGAERCEAFRDRIAGGEEDLTRLDADLVQRVRRYARQFTPS